MKIELHKFFVLLIIGAAALCSLSSCKKDKEETDDTPYLKGTLSYQYAPYILPGEELTLVPKGAVHPQEGNIGYAWKFSWKSNPDTTKYLSDPTYNDGSITVKAPSTIGTYTINLSAFASGYYGLSTSSELIVVSDELNSSVSNTGIRISNPKVVDERDGNEYYITEIAGLEWMRHNLAYSGSGVPYRNSPAMSKLFGRYYSYEEALTACPEGWRLPTEEDWLQLGRSLTSQELDSDSIWKGVAGDLMVDAYFQGTKMWDYWPKVKITNVTRFGAISAGYAVDETSVTFYGGQKYATFWSADLADEEHAYYRYINVESPDVYVGKANKETFKASVRCVRDIQ